MSKPTTRQIQEKALECVREVRRICEKNDISYFLGWGSALGARRHGGCIPWDDDIDLCMFYPEYLRFLKACETDLDKERFFLQTPQTDPHTLVPYAKLRMNGTVSMDEKYSHIPMHWGLCIDVFPLRYAPDSPKKQKKLFFWGKMVRLTRRKEVLTGKNRTMVNLLSALMGGGAKLQKFAVSKVEKLCVEHSDTIFDMEGYSTHQVFYKASLVEKTKPLSFEGEMYPCPDPVEDYLEYLYGDWATPPEAPNRTGHEGVVIDLNHSYEEYMAMQKEPVSVK